MIEQTAKVVAVEGDSVWVEAGRQSACGACAMNKGCGAGTFAKLFRFSAPHLRVARIPNVVVGDYVRLGIDERALVRGSFVAYVVPIIFMLAFALLGEYLAQNWLALHADGLTLIFGFMGLAMGLVWLARYSQTIRHDPRYEPIILSTVDEGVGSSCSKRA